MLRVWIGFSLLFALVACGTPSAKLEGARFSSLTLEGVTIDFDMSVSNPTAVPIPLTAIDYGLASGQTTFVNGTAPLSGVVPARGSRTIALPVTISFAELRSAVSTVRLGTLVPYTASLAMLTGASDSPAARWPLSYSGKIPVALPPTISVKEATWRSPNFSALRGTVALAVSNPNEFAVMLRDLDTKIMFGDTPIVSGVASPLQLDAGGSGTLQLDVDLPLREIGGMLGTIMSASASSFSASGRMRMTGEFGEIDLPFTSR